MKGSNTAPRWPVWLWAAQLVPAGLVVVFAVARLSSRSGLESFDFKASFALLVGLVWFLGVLAFLLTARSRTWLRSYWREWCLSASATLAGLIVLDAVLTVTGVVPSIDAQNSRSPDYTYGQFTRFRFVPKSISLENGSKIKINRRGFRGPEIDEHKREGTHRIVFLGGSQVFDYHGGGWPSMAGRFLQTRGYDVEIVNAGVPGHNTTDSLGKLFSDLWILKPDLIFLCNTWNDVKYFPRLSVNEPYRGLPPLSPTGWRVDWRLHPSGLDRWLSVSSLYRAVRVSIVDLLVSEEGTMREFRPATDGRGIDWGSGNALGPRQFEINLKLISALTREIGAELVLCRQARLEKGRGTNGQSVEDYTLRNTGLTLSELERAFSISNSVIDNVAIERQLEVVDMHAMLGSKERLFLDGIHFSPEGSEVVARFVADALEDNLQR